MTTWLKRGDPIPDCSLIREAAATIYTDDGLPERVDLPDTYSTDELGVTIRMPRRLHDPKVMDRIVRVDRFIPWARIKTIVREEHERDGVHAFDPIDVQPPAEFRNDYPNGVGLFCEICNTIAPLTAAQEAELAAGQDVTVEKLLAASNP